MTLSNALRERRPGLRLALAVLLAVFVAVGAYLAWPGRGGNKIVGYFTSAVGLYPGDQIRIVGVPVGTIESIEPRAEDVKITMSLDRDVKVPADARAIIMSPNLVAARFIQLAPAYTSGPALPERATIALAHTAVPVEWDEVKQSLTDLAKQLSPAAGQLQGPLGKAINQAADTFNGNGDSFRTSLRELSQVAGRLGDSRTDIFGTVKNLQVLVDALSASNEQIVAFSGHVASVSQVLAKSSTHLDNTLGTLNQALIDVKGFLQQNNSTLIGTVNKLTDLTQVLSDQSEEIDPAQGTLNGLISIPEFANPVQFICGGSFDTAAGLSGPDYYKRAEICRERLGPPLRRLTFNYPPLMFHPLNTITAYKGQIQYDTPETQAKSQTPIPDLHWIPAPGAHPPNPADLQALMVPQTSTNGPAPGAPAPAPNPFGPRPGPAPAAPAPPLPLPAEQGAGR
jgi:phospholipid/cholesterol/gamma-HCH transport system substrate-binding protein